MTHIVHKYWPTLISPQPGGYEPHSPECVEGAFSEVLLRKTYEGAPPLVQVPSLPTVTVPLPPRAH